MGQINRCLCTRMGIWSKRQVYGEGRRRPHIIISPVDAGGWTYSDSLPFLSSVLFCKLCICLYLLTIWVLVVLLFFFGRDAHFG